MTSLRANVFKWLDCGSPPWTRFELLRANGHSDRKIEPANEERFQKGRSGMPIIVHDGPPALDTSRTHRLGPQVAQIGLHVPIVALRAHLSECTFANALTLSGLLTSQCSRMCVF